MLAKLTCDHGYYLTKKANSILTGNLNCNLDANSKEIWLHCTGRNIFDVRKFQWLSQELNKLRESLRKSSLPFWSRKSVKTCLNWNSFMLLGSSSLAVAASRFCYKILSTFCFFQEIRRNQDTNMSITLIHFTGINSKTYHASL